MPIRVEFKTDHSTIVATRVLAGDDLRTRPYSIAINPAVPPEYRGMITEITIQVV